MTRITFWLTVGLASVVPVAAVACVNGGGVKWEVVRRGVLVNGLAGVCLGMFARPSRAEVFLFAVL